MQPVEILVLALPLMAFALVSRKAEGGIVTPPMAFAGLGLLLGSSGMGLLDIGVDGEVVRTLAEVTLVLTLFCDASRIDVTELDRRHRIPMRLLGIGLPLTIVVGTGAAWVLFPILGFWGAMALSVVLAPTDAALGQAVMSNRSVPQRVRQALNVESGLNDGLAFPALLIAISLAAGADGRDGTGWAAFLGAQLILGPLIGVAAGWIGGRLADAAMARAWMDEIYLRLATIALPLVAYGGAELVEGNGFLAAFACGLVVAARTTRLREAAGRFGEAEGQLLSLIVFVLFGALLLPALPGIDWRHATFAVLALTVLRMGAVALSLAGLGLGRGTLAFLGWFGPRGLASVIYLLLILEEYAIPGIDDLHATVLLTVAASIVLHGVTAAPLARRYGRGASGDVPEPAHRFPFRFDARRGGADHREEERRP